MLSLLKAVVQLLVGELQSHKLHGIVKKKKVQNKKILPPPSKNKNKKTKHSTTYKIEKGGNI